jgi:hypothetical protein
MSIGSIPNSNAAQQWQAMQRQRASKSDTPPDQSGSAGSSAPASTNSFPVDLRTTPYDEMSVTLPSGLKVGVMHLGSSLDASTEQEMIKSMEQLVGGLQGYSASGSPAAATGTTPAAGATGSGGAADPGQGDIDQIDVDLPNGLSLEVKHGSSGADGSDGAAIDDRLTQEMTDLLSALKAYSGTSSTGAAASPAATSSASANKVA